MFSKTLAILALCVLPAFTAPPPLVEVQKAKEPIDGRYIITLKEGADRKIHINSFSRQAITHEWDIVNGFAGTFYSSEIETLRSHPDVVSIEEDGLVHTQSTITQFDAPWGLGRISSWTELADQESTALTFSYDYDASAGVNSDVYIIDTGIFISHPAFEGRASWGITFGNYSDADGNGHGTHCAGIAVSSLYGVSKSSKVIAVKVLDNNGTGSWADIISGVNWVANTARNSGRPSVASMSLAGSYMTAINTAVANLVFSGVTTIVAAGNDNTDAGDSSPASAPSVITVGATTIADARASYSNYGAVVDIWAPGTNITSTWNTGGAKLLSGTSMATPHVAGYAAYLLTLDSSLTPAGVDSTIKSRALNNVLSGIPSGTINALINNGL